MIFPLTLLFILGAVTGSFLNVCIYRLPRKGSVVSPGSYCPRCDLPVRWYDNVPLLSYLWLKGRCRNCGERISVRYPLVELLNAVLYLLAGLKFGIEPALLPALLFISALIVIFFIDIEFYIIPNVIVLPVAAVGLAAAIALNPGRWYEYLIAGLVSAAFFFIVVMLKPGGMGMGDVKMAGMMGFFLGWPVTVALFTGFLLGAVTGVALIIAGRKGRKSRLPFGPFLAIGALVALFFGEFLLETYLGLFDSAPAAALIERVGGTGY